MAMDAAGAEKAIGAVVKTVPDHQRGKLGNNVHRIFSEQPIDICDAVNRIDEITRQVPAHRLEELREEIMAFFPPVDQDIDETFVAEANESIKDPGVREIAREFDLVSVSGITTVIEKRNRIT